MNKIIQSVIFLFLIVGCSTQPDDIVELNTQIHRLVESINDQTYDRYSNIDVLLIINENANRAFHDKAVHIKSFNDSIIVLLRQSKNPESIIQEVVGNYMEFTNKLGLYKRSTSRIINERLDYWSSLKRRSINIDLLEADIRLCELDIINELYDNYKKNGFYFNTITPVILDTKKELSLGEIYTARIGIQAYDSTLLPIVYKDETMLEVKEGFGIFRYTSTTPGIKNISGKIMVMKADYTVDSLNYEYQIEFK